MTKTELTEINKRGYKYDNNLASLLEKNPKVLTAGEAYQLYESIKDNYADTDKALCLSFEVLRINKQNEKV